MSAPSRVRDLFEQAKTNAPAIIFVDEIDAVGRHRGAGMGGGHDEREQTLNQLLVEMDGFDVKGGVIMIAATNRPDILDPALLRPGRFDRQIAVGPPDVIGREAVLKVHAKGKPFAADVDLGVIARRTPGFTGADLANVINEAALLTARNNGRLITDAALEESIDRVIAGPERKTRAMSDKEKRVTAYHEAGHALTAWAMPNLDPVHKVTILPRGRSLGHTLVLPLEDRYTQTRAEILDQLVYALGGRAAEELVFHEPTTGASNDIEKATKLARSMVTEYGMSAKLGAVKYGTGDAEPFMGRDYGHQRDYSEDIAADIDAEVRDLIEGAHDEAWEILVQYRDVLDADGARAGREGDAGQGRPRAHPRAGAQAPAAQHLHRASASARRATGRRSRSRRRCARRRPTGRTARTVNGNGNGNGNGAERRRRGARPGAAAAGTGRSRRPARAVLRPAARWPGAALRRLPAAERLGLRRRAAARTGRSGRHRSGAGRPVPRPGKRPARPVPAPTTAAGERRGGRPGPGRGGRPRTADRDRRGPRPRGPAGHPGAGRAAATPRSSPACTSTRTRSCRRPSTSTTTSWCWSRTSRCTRPASTTWCPGTARPPSATSRARTAGSPGCPSWPGSSTSTPAARRCRSG